MDIKKITSTEGMIIDEKEQFFGTNVYSIKSEHLTRVLRVYEDGNIVGWNEDSLLLSSGFDFWIKPDSTFGYKKYIIRL